MIQITPHFSLEELTHSQTAIRLGIFNDPNAAQLKNLSRLCNLLLEPARALLQEPLFIDSGFRSPALNQAVGGAASSAHLDGRAADIRVGVDLEATFDRLRNSNLPYDQIIFECRAWIHLAIAREGEQPRRDMLVAVGGPGSWSYARAK